MALLGKKVVVIGGSSGIGLAVAKRALSEGADVVVSTRSPDKFERIGQLLPAAKVLEINLADKTQIQQFFDHVGIYDHLVFTAGDALLHSPLSELSLTAAKEFFEVRYFGVFHCIQCGKATIRPEGSITLTSGMSGRRPRKGWAVVSSVCGAVESFGKALAIELAPVRVNVVCPGIVKTPLWDVKPANEVAAMYERFEQVLPVGHVGHPDELAKAYLFLMESTFSTGSVVVVDGGISLTSA